MTIEVGYGGKRIFDGMILTTAGFATNDDDLTALQRLVRLAHRLKGGPINVLEIGTWVGESACAALNAMERGQVHVHCVDHWKGTASDLTAGLLGAIGRETVLDICMKNLNDYFDSSQFTVHIGDSETVESFYQDDIDLVYIDADHTYEGCKADIERWLPHVT
jgi:predicted O-methyltransferase YrrM